MIDIKLLSEGIVLDGVYLSEHDLNSSFLEDLGSFSELGVTLMLVEVSNDKIMLLCHFFKVVLMEVDHFVILKDRLFSKLRVFGIFRIDVACNEMVGVFRVKRVSVLLL